MEVPPSSLRAANRRGNPDWLCDTLWIATATASPRNDEIGQIGHFEEPAVFGLMGGEGSDRGLWCVRSGNFGPVFVGFRGRSAARHPILAP